MSAVVNPGSHTPLNAVIYAHGGPSYGVSFADGPTVPSDGAAGFCIGGIFLDTDAAAGSQLWVNTGTLASAAFKKLVYDGMTVAAQTITTLTTNAINMAAAASTITLKANTAAALGITDATTVAISVDTRNTLKNVHTVTITGVPVTVASEAAAHLNSSLNLAAKTITYSGTTGTTSSFGAMLNVGVVTFTDASVMTLSAASAVHINAIAAAGGSLTITASYMISTSVSDCFLTNAGVWTDHSCWSDIKVGIDRAWDGAAKAVESLMDQIVPATWQYAKEVKQLGQRRIDENDPNSATESFNYMTPLDDFGRERVGIVYDDLPGELRAPGEARGVAPGVLASFALAALKLLWDRNKDLEQRLAKLEGA